MNIKDKICLIIGKAVIYMILMFIACVGVIICLGGHDNLVICIIGSLMFIIGMVGMCTMLNNEEEEDP